MSTDIHRHDCACGPLDRCSFCGCCQHCTSRCDCKMDSAPEGVPCRDSGCGCEGRS